MNGLDREGLMWPSKNMVMFCGTCIHVIRRMLDDDFLDEFNSSTTSSRASTKVVINFMMQCSSDYVFLTDFNEVCEVCDKNRTKTMIEKCFGAMSRIGMNNLTQALNKTITQQ